MTNNPLTIRCNMTNELDRTKGIVCYIDGSSRPNPGFIGWGAHGYFYDIKDLKKPITVDLFTVTNKGYLTTDEIKTEEYLAVEPTKYFDFLGSVSFQGTNNLAEIMALSNTLERLEEFNVKHIHVRTDSEYLRKGIEIWCKNWERYNWRNQEGQPIINKEWWERAYSKVKALKAKGVTFNITWVKAHNDMLGNVQADVLSVIGMNYSRSGKVQNDYNFSETKGYWKYDIEKHPFINFKRIYFNSVREYNISGHYFQADPGSNEFTIGKRIPETGFGVIKLKEKNEIIEAVKERQYETANDINAIIMMRLDRVFSKEIYPYLEYYGGYCLLDGKNNLNLNFVDNKPVTMELNPTGLSLRAIESFNLLDELITRFLSYREIGVDNPDNNIKLNYHDITSTFFLPHEKNPKKCILKPEYVVGFTNLTVEVNEEYQNSFKTLKVPLILGTDLISRNSLKKLEDKEPKVYLITWRESLESIRYATVIECDDGIGIWSNFFSDKIFF
jgi:ribonuclease HI